MHSKISLSAAPVCFIFVYVSTFATTPAIQQVTYGVYLADLSNSTADVSFNNGEDIGNFGVALGSAVLAVFGNDLGPASN